MSKNTTIEHSHFLNHLFLNDSPLLDVRSPCEFEHGHFPTSHNIPVLDNEERKQVGICYKQKSASDAIELGHSLVSGSKLTSRGKSWINFIGKNPGTHIYCARGGLRSQKVHQWLLSNGIDCPIVPSGYKSMRHHLLDTIDKADTDFNFIVIGGPTGSGKTHFINSLSYSVIDLEGLANHRGSSFGRRFEEQPSQASFENRLAIALIKAKAKGVRTIIIEDESKLIGRCCLPVIFQKIIKSSPLLLLKEPKESRIKIINDDYVIHDLNHRFRVYGHEKAIELFMAQLQQNLGRISKRLGAERAAEIGNLIDHAITVYRKTDDTRFAYPIIEKLLDYYYDPMYQYQIASKDRNIITAGSREEITLWIEEYMKEKAVSCISS